MCGFAGLVLWWWLQPEQQIRRAQTRLIAAIESRDLVAFERLLADDYSDSWGHNKAIVVSQANEVLRQFLMLSVEHEEKGLTFKGATWVVSEKIILKGTGGPLAIYAKDEVGRLREPFAITWRKNGSATQWVITSVAQPELHLP